MQSPKKKFSSFKYTDVIFLPEISPLYYPLMDKYPQKYFHHDGVFSMH